MLTQAETREGISEVWQAVEDHRAAMEASDKEATGEDQSCAARFADTVSSDCLIGRLKRQEARNELS